MKVHLIKVLETLAQASAQGWDLFVANFAIALLLIAVVVNLVTFGYSLGYGRYKANKNRYLIEAALSLTFGSLLLLIQLVLNLVGKLWQSVNKHLSLSFYYHSRFTGRFLNMSDKALKSMHKDAAKAHDSNSVMDRTSRVCYRIIAERNNYTHGDVT